MSMAGENDDDAPSAPDAEADEDSQWSTATNHAREGIAALMKLADGEDRIAAEELRTIAIMITRYLHRRPPVPETDPEKKAFKAFKASKADRMMPTASEFPVVLSAGNEQRGQELAAFKALPIGKSVGFPHRPGGKSGASYDDSPAGFWRETQFWIDALRGLTEIARDDLSSIVDGAGIPLAVSLGLIEKIAALPDFGEGGENEWLEVALELIESNPDMIPQWILARSLAGKGQRGLRSKWKEQLSQGLKNCGSTP